MKYKGQKEYILAIIGIYSIAKTDEKGVIAIEGKGRGTKYIIK